MSTSILHHIFKAVGVQYKSTTYFSDRNVFKGEMSPNYIRCPECKSTNVIKFGYKERLFKTLPVGNKKTELLVKIPRIRCIKCAAVRQINIPFADDKKHYLRALERYVVDLCKVMTISAVAEITGLCWDTVKAIHKKFLSRKFKNIKLKDVKYIAIDELYLGKRQKFITIVLDLLSGRVIYIGKGKGKDALKGFWRRLDRSKARIEAVATDMASGYMHAVLEHLCDADLVLDHFHLVKWFNDKLSKLRRDIYREANAIDRKILKGSRWLLIKAPENLKSHNDKNKDQCYKLQQALEINQPLAKSYYMKERLRLMFQCSNKEQAENELSYWINEAQDSGIKILVDAARKLLVWKPCILNWYKHRISTSKLEACNGKIGTLQRNARGYRDQEYFRLRIFNIHNENYALFG